MTEYQEKWVRVMADYDADGIWRKDGCMMSIDDLPVSRQIAWNLGCWQAVHDRYDHEGPMDKKTLAWFAESGRQIAKRIKQELPDWTVIYFDSQRFDIERDNQPRAEFEYEIVA